MAAPPRWLVVVAVMLTTVMVILDMTIVNVAMPHMMGALGATADQVTWVLTSYIVAEAIVIPLTGFLAGRLGRRHLLLAAISGFVFFSALCGQAGSLAEMVLFRLLQGAFGAVVIPISQAVLVDLFPGEERGKGMALWGIGIMMGPVLGPSLGGLITEYLNWRMVFYINLPVGLLNLVLVAMVIAPAAGRRASVDWIGALAMAVGIGSLQLVLDRGNQENWWDSRLIVILTVVSVLALMLFFRRSWQRDDSVVHLRLLRDNSLRMASLIIGAFGLGMFGTIALQPILMEDLLGYPAATTGLIMAPRGLGSAVGMLLVARLITRFDPRYLIGTGLVLSATTTFIMSHYNLGISPGWLIWPGLLQGLGMGMIFVPLTTLAYQTLPRQSVDQAAGIFNLARTIGSSAGISIAATVLTRSTQVHWSHLGGFINPYNPALNAWLQTQGMTLADPQAPAILAQELLRQASMLAFVDTFRMIAWSFVLLAPLLLLISVRRPSGPAPAGPID